MSEKELPKVFVCNDGVIIWWGYRGEKGKLTYQTYLFNNSSKKINQPLKNVLRWLKEGKYEE